MSLNVGTWSEERFYRDIWEIISNVLVPLTDLGHQEAKLKLK